jgi:hypothetical protein
MPEDERGKAIASLLSGVNVALQPIFSGQNFTPEQAEHFEGRVQEAWMDALDLASQGGDDALSDGLQAMLERTFDRWRELIGVEFLNRYGRELMLNAIDREWVDYLTAMEDLRQGISLQGIAQRDPLVAYKTQAFGMFGELLETIDRATVRTFFTNLPRFALQVQQQQAAGQVARTRDVKVGPNEPCPCGSGKKFKKCHGAPARAVATPASSPVAALSGDGMLVNGGNGSTAVPVKKVTQQQQQKQSKQEPARRKTKGRSVPGRRP